MLLPESMASIGYSIFPSLFFQSQSVISGDNLVGLAQLKSSWIPICLMFFPTRFFIVFWQVSQDRVSQPFTLHCYFWGAKAILVPILLGTAWRSNEASKWAQEWKEWMVIFMGLFIILGIADDWQHFQTEYVVDPPERGREVQNQPISDLGKIITQTTTETLPNPGTETQATEHRIIIFSKLYINCLHPKLSLWLKKCNHPGINGFSPCLIGEWMRCLMSIKFQIPSTPGWLCVYPRERERERHINMSTYI